MLELLLLFFVSPRHVTDARTNHQRAPKLTQKTCMDVRIIKHQLKAHILQLTIANYQDRYSEHPCTTIL